jgi:hypothetical protein
MFGRYIRKPNGVHTVSLISDLVSRVSVSLGLHDDAACSLVTEAMGADVTDIFDAGPDLFPHVQAEYVHRACSVLWRAVLERGRRQSNAGGDDDAPLDIPEQLLRRSGPTAEEDDALRMQEVDAVLAALLSTCVCTLHADDASSLLLRPDRFEIDSDLESLFTFLKRALTASSLTLMEDAHDVLRSQARAFMLHAIRDMPPLAYASEDVIHAPSQMAAFVRRGVRMGYTQPRSDAFAAATRALGRRKSAAEIPAALRPMLRLQLRAGGSDAVELVSPPSARPERPHHVTKGVVAVTAVLRGRPPSEGRKRM